MAKPGARGTFESNRSAAPCLYRYVLGLPPGELLPVKHRNGLQDLDGVELDGIISERDDHLFRTGPSRPQWS